ncbi:MAG: hypothetical protein J0L75_18860 [Spirochaetes bacterium]|nr:hypothetical protein [Spirochaetota bacterium]
MKHCYISNMIHRRGWRLLPILLVSLAAAAPLPPILLSPAEGERSAVGTPSFYWDWASNLSAPAPTDGRRYEIQLAADPGFARMVDEDAVDIPRYVADRPLAGELWWRVRTLQGGQGSAWSPARRLTIEIPKRVFEIPAGADLAAIRAVVSNALATGAPARIAFAQGATYRIAVDGALPQGHRSARFHLLELSRARDLVVEGRGATIIFTRPTMGLANLAACTNVQLGGFKVDYDPVTYLSGIVRSVSGAELVVQPDAGCPAWTDPLVKYHWSAMGVLDPAHPGRLLAGAPNLFPSPKSAALEADGSVRLAFASAPPSFFAPGARVLQWIRDRGVEMTEARECSNITWHDTVNYACPAGHYLSLDGSDFKVLHCDSVLKPGRWVSGNADGVHTRANVIGPWMEGCDFEAFGDDGVAIYNKGMFIVGAPDLGTVRVSNSLFLLKPGDRFTVFNPREGVCVGPLRECLSVSALQQDGFGAHFVVTFRPPLEKPPTVDADGPRGDQLFNRSRANALSMVRGNRIRNIRRYGTVLRAVHSVVEHNLYEGCSAAGVMIRNEAAFWRNGLYSEGLLIRSNLLRDTAFDTSGEGAIVARFESLAGSVKRPMHGRIAIEGNTLEGWNLAGIRAEAVGDLRITGNTIRSRGAVFPEETSLPTGIRLLGCAPVLVNGNRVEDARPLAAALSLEACAAVVTNGNAFRFKALEGVAGLVLYAEDEACARSGTWSGSGLKGFGGRGTYWTGTVGASAIWTAPATGKKELWFWRVAYVGNDPGAKVVVRHGGGESAVVMDTRGEKPGWVPLGAFDFKGRLEVRVEKVGGEGNLRLCALRVADPSPR